MTQNTKAPPYSLEAERSLLGALLLDPEAFDQIADVIVEQSFYQKSHQAR